MMNTAGLRRDLVVAFVIASTAVPAGAQEAAVPVAETASAGPRIVLNSTAPVQMPALLPGRLVRVIEDPNLGDHWLLCRSLDHPGGPGRLLQVAANRVARMNKLAGSARAVEAVAFNDAAMPAIRAGDWVVVEENSAVAQARLGAVALESATIGSAFHARMEIGGRVLRVVAVGSGRAVFLLQNGAGR